MANRDNYTTPASEQGKTSRDIVVERLEKLGELKSNGAKIMDTNMKAAFAEAV